MGQNNFTFDDEQVLADCPSCERRIRLRGETGVSKILCGNCQTVFHADRQNGQMVRVVE